MTADLPAEIAKSKGHQFSKSAKCSKINF